MREQTEKQRNAAKRNFAIMRLRGVIATLNDITTQYPEITLDAAVAFVALEKILKVLKVRGQTP